MMMMTTMFIKCMWVCECYEQLNIVASILSLGVDDDGDGIESIIQSQLC